MTETELRENIRDAAKKLGWGYYHSWISIHSAAGFPDCIMVKIMSDGKAVMLAVELKSDIGKLSQPQFEWLEVLSKVPGVSAFVWKPKDWDSGEIARILASK